MENQNRDTLYQSISELQNLLLSDISHVRSIDESLISVQVWFEKIAQGRYFTIIHYVEGNPITMRLGTPLAYKNTNQLTTETIDLVNHKYYSSIRKNKNPILESKINPNDALLKSFINTSNEQDKLYWPIIFDGEFIGAITIYYTNGYDDRENDLLILELVNNTLAALLISAKNQSKVFNTHAILKKSVQQAPVLMGLLRGSDMVIEWYNDILEPIWAKGRDVIGMRLIEAQPELINEPYFIDQLTTVYQTGEPFRGTEALSRININGKLEDKYFDYVYHPIKNANGITEAVLVIAPDVTERVIAKTLIQAQEVMFKEMVMMAPFIILILRGPEMIIEIGNAPLFSYWNKPREEVMGKALLEVLPELNDQPFVNILNRVYQSGESFGDKEVLNFFETPEGKVNKYVSYLYQPLKDSAGKVDGIMVTAEDVTNEVTSRQELVLSEQRLRLANTAAQLGTFDLDLLSGVFLWDKRCRELFGITHENAVSYEKDFLPGLHPEDKDRVAKLIENMYKMEIADGEYDNVFRTVGVEDGKTRWIRAKGKTFFDEKNHPYRFVGVVIDITDNKLDEIRKSDFIAMVSHELKTPLTSLKSYVQVALLEARKSEANHISKFMERANVQIAKMSTMINDFLDLSRLESGHMPFKPEQFVVQSLISACVLDIQTISPCNIVIEKCEEITIIADREKISHVILNILSNAIKYSPKMSEINVRCWVEKKQVMISITDKGDGIEEEHIPKLFDRFYRVKNKSHDTTSGFGIGLYLVAEIIEMHKGAIDVKSKIGKGSTFTISLPI
jgi:PAS domain S-box-containing protein